VIDTSLAARITTFIFVTAAVFLTGGLIGALVAAVNARLDALRRGRSRVLESGHTVVIGWSARLIAVLDELMAENPEGSQVIAVVLADRDKTQMEDEARAKHEGKARNRVVFRSGRPTAKADLQMVAVDAARSVIALSEGGFVDAMAVRRSLAAFAIERGDAHVVAELSNPRVARSLRELTNDGVVSVTVGEVVADMTAQAIRGEGLAHVFEELLSFGGHELYIVPAGAASGHRFGDLALSIPGVCVIGVVSGGVVELVPDPDRSIRDDEELVVISAARPGTLTPGERPAGRGTPEPTSGRETVLVIGWNPTGPGILTRLIPFLAAGSEIHVMADFSLLPDEPEWEWDVPGAFTHTKHDPDHVFRMIGETKADVVAVLGYSGALTEEEADALTLLTLVTLEQGRRDGKTEHTRVVAHLFSGDLADMAEGSGTSDFVVTDSLASHMLVHTSRHPELAAVFADLFDADGPVLNSFSIAAVGGQYGPVASALSQHGAIPIGVIDGGDIELVPSFDLELSSGARLIAVHRPDRT
jgi:hypothetical protein